MGASHIFLVVHWGKNVITLFFFKDFEAVEHQKDFLDEFYNTSE
jgi:hypothetical protein